MRACVCACVVGLDEKTNNTISLGFILFIFFMRRAILILLVCDYLFFVFFLHMTHSPSITAASLEAGPSFFFLSFSLT